jgi:hypothetical protein
MEVLYDMVARYRRPDSVVVCPYMTEKLYRIARPIAESHGFLAVDVSFLHEKKGYENPYYAFHKYPEYDARAAAGAVEFRTHPSDLGHDAIAKSMLNAVKKQIPKTVEQGVFNEPYRFEEYVQPEKLPAFRVRTEPEMYVTFHGFNVRQEGDCVTFGSAPETGASVELAGIRFVPPIGTFYVEMAVNGVEQKERMTLTVKTKTETRTYQVDLHDDQMHRYIFDLSEIAENVYGIRISPDMTDCVLTVRALGFSNEEK